MNARTRDATLILRLWLEPHDTQVRARLLDPDHDPDVLIGVDGIVEAVEARIRSFVAG